MLSLKEIQDAHNQMRSDIRESVRRFNFLSGMTVDTLYLSYWKEIGKPNSLKTVQTKLTLPNYNDASDTTGSS